MLIVYNILPICHKEKSPDLVVQGASPFFTHSYWDLETTMTTFKNNIILRAHLEHSESW